MNKNSYKGFVIGDRVSVKETDSSYDHGPDITPEMTGTIKSFPPKVRRVKGPLYDNGYYFAYVEFDETYASHGRIYQIRGGIDICNLKKRVKYDLKILTQSRINHVKKN